MAIIIKMKDEDIKLNGIHDLNSEFVTSSLVHFNDDDSEQKLQLCELASPTLPISESVIKFSKYIDPILSKHLEATNENPSYLYWKRYYLETSFFGELEKSDRSDIVVDVEKSNESVIYIPIGNNIKIRFTMYYESNNTKSGVSQKTFEKSAKKIGADVNLIVSLDLDSATTHLKNIIENEAKKGQQVFLSALRDLPKSSFIRYMNDLGMLQIAKTLSKEYNHEVVTKENAKSILEEMDIFLGDSSLSSESVNVQGRYHLPSNGTKMYCPSCDAITTCHDASENNEDTNGHKNYYNKEQPPVNWYRRARMCSACGHEFLTGEIQESLIDELATLKQIQGAPPRLLPDGSRYDDGSWLNHDTSSRIPYAWAHEFIACTTWWLHHPSGAVRAPKHADRIFESEQHGWAIEFGANTFLIETAIIRSLNAVKNLLNLSETGREELISEIKTHASGAVANHYGEEYSGYYPLDGNDMVFGSTSIDVDDAAKFILEKAQYEV